MRVHYNTVPIVLLAVVIIGLLAGFLARAYLKPFLQHWYLERQLSHYQEYFNTRPSYDEVVQFFKDLATKKGGVYAFSILINAKLPPNVDTHLVGHDVGTVLYFQQGLEALKYCTQDLGYACAHSIVINELLVKGEVVFDDIKGICEKAEGPGAYPMCFHGFGHGVLAYTNYKLPEAIKLCQRVGSVQYQGVEIDECIGGIVMEMRGGIHSPRLWEANGKPYLSSTNPFAMCEADYMPDANKDMCYIYITPFIYDSVNAGSLPTDDETRAAFARCEEVENVANRRVCYGGFAKELVNFVYGRDVRLVFHASDGELKRMFDQCLLAPTDLGKEECVKYMVSQLYRGGMYTPLLAARYCSVTSDTYTDFCFTRHHQEVLRTYVEKTEYKEYCAFIEKVYKPLCEQVP